MAEETNEPVLAPRDGYAIELVGAASSIRRRTAALSHSLVVPKGRIPMDLARELTSDIHAAMADLHLTLANLEFAKLRAEKEATDDH